MDRLCILVLLVATRLAAAAETPKPVMALATEEWNFGTLEQGQTASKDIEVTNRGSADLKITLIRSSCATCIGNVSGARLIKPGGNGRITLSFYSKGLLGRQSKVVYVHGNDPATPFKAIRIVGTVRKSRRPQLHLAADTLDLGLVGKGRSVVRALSIENKGQAPLRVTGVAVSEACRVQLPKGQEIPPGQTAELRVTLFADKLDGLIQEHITLHTNDPVTPSKTLSIVGYAADPAEAGAGPARGIAISPVGKPVGVPGTGTVFHRTYRIVNTLPTPVHLRFACGHGDPQSAKLSPGQTTTIGVPTAILDDERPKKALLEFVVRVPAVLTTK